MDDLVERNVLSLLKASGPNLAAQVCALLHCKLAQQLSAWLEQKHAQSTITTMSCNRKSQQCVQYRLSVRINSCMMNVCCRLLLRMQTWSQALSAKWCLWKPQTQLSRSRYKPCSSNNSSRHSTAVNLSSCCTTSSSPAHLAMRHANNSSSSRSCRTRSNKCSTCSWSCSGYGNSAEQHGSR